MADNTQRNDFPNSSRFTESVVGTIGEQTSPRLKEVMTSLIRHSHAFVRDVGLTTDEFMAALQMLNWAGQMTTQSRNEGLLLSDVIGIESLVDIITQEKTRASGNGVTSSAILGPFWRSDTPVREFGSSITFDTASDAEVAYLYGTVTDAETGNPIPNALVDVWQASTNGLYEQQDPEQREHNLRGKFYTNEEGQYAYYGIRPTPYPIPTDGPAGQLLLMLHRHPYRPAHIHYMVTAEGYTPVTTQIFDKHAKYLEDDAVFAVKDDLLVEFVPRTGDPKASIQVEYNITLSPK